TRGGSPGAGRLDSSRRVDYLPTTYCAITSFSEHRVQPMHATDRYPSAVARAAAVLVGIFLGGTAAPAQEPDAAPPEKPYVHDILGQGNRRVTAQDVLGKLKTHVNGEYRPETVQEDVRLLLETKQFGNVQARYKVLPGTNKVDVYFIVVDYPNTVQEVVYKGCHTINKSELEALTGVRKNAPLNPVNNQLACQAIVN